MEGVFARLLVAKNALRPDIDERMRIGLSSIHSRALEVALGKFEGSFDVDDVIKLCDEIQGVKFSPNDCISSKSKRESNRGIHSKHGRDSRLRSEKRLPPSVPLELEPG